jgi:SET domain-containing protein
MPAITSYRSDKIAVHHSQLEGRGIIAIAPIKKDEIVAIKSGHIVDAKQVLKITAQIGDYSLQIHDDFFLTPITEEEIKQTTIFINHSCDANVGFRGQVIYVAMKDILPGDELCHDYALARTAAYSMKCHCGAVKCRGTVTGDDWQLPGVQQKYGDYFVTYVKEKIITKNASS